MEEIIIAYELGICCLSEKAHFLLKKENKKLSSLDSIY